MLSTQILKLCAPKLPDFSLALGKEWFFLLAAALTVFLKLNYYFNKNSMLSLRKALTVRSKQGGLISVYFLERNSCSVFSSLEVSLVWSCWAGVEGLGGWWLDRERYLCEEGEG